MSVTLADLSKFNELIFQTVNAAFAAGLESDILTAIGSITGAVVARGLDPVADMAALQALNKIIADLAKARAQIIAAPPTPAPAA